MATFTITTDAAQDTALTAFIAAINAEGAAQKPALPALTVADYVQARFSDVIASYVGKITADDAVAVKVAYDAATAAKKAQVKTTLGI